ncbi:CBS domain-containing protein [Planctomycetota bacterium]
MFEAKTIMKTEVITVNKNNFRRVPIVHKGKPIGVVSRKDIIEYILKLRRKNTVTA